MKNIIRSILCSVLAVSVLGSSMTAWGSSIDSTSLSGETNIQDFAGNIKSIYISRYPEQTNLIEEMVDTICSDEQFVSIFEQDKASALVIAEDFLDDALIPSAQPLAWQEDMYYTCHLTQAIRQSENNYCGIACIVMALMGCGKMELYDEVQENGQWVTAPSEWEKIRKKQEDIATYIRTYYQPNLIPGGGDGVVVGNLNNYLNYACGFNSSSFKYETRYRNYNYGSGHLSALDDVTDCLYYDALPVVWVPDTSVLGYYNGESFRHYIIIETVDYTSKEITVLDPHYSNKYFGRNYISFDEFYDIFKSGAWLSVYTNKGSQ